MKTSLLGFSIPSFALGIAIAVPPAGAAQALTKVTMTTGSFSEREAAMYVAQDQGFFRRYGLELTFVQVRNGPIGMAALAGGESRASRRLRHRRCARFRCGRDRSECLSPA